MAKADDEMFTYLLTKDEDPLVGIEQPEPYTA
jgi:hypothetical protein